MLEKDALNAFKVEQQEGGNQFVRLERDMTDAEKEKAHNDSIGWIKDLGGYKSALKTKYQGEQEVTSGKSNPQRKEVITNWIKSRISPVRPLVYSYEADGNSAYGIILDETGLPGIDKIPAKNSSEWKNFPKWKEDIKSLIDNIRPKLNKVKPATNNSGEVRLNIRGDLYVNYVYLLDALCCDGSRSNSRVSLLQAAASAPGSASAPSISQPAPVTPAPQVRKRGGEGS